MTKEKKAKFWNFVDNLEGDKVVWIIVLLLIMISIVSVFSSTSLLAIEQGSSRMNIIRGQLLFSLVGLGVIILIYNLKNMHWFKLGSQLGFGACLIPLLMLGAHVDLGVIKAQHINEAWRTLKIFGFQFHVFEFTKITMVMYLSWAIDAFENNEFRLSKMISKLPHMKFFGTKTGEKWMYIYGPIGIICLLVMMGSISSSIFITAIMVVTILVGGISIKDLVKPIIIGVISVTAIVYTGYTLSGHTMFERIATAPSRLKPEYTMDDLVKYSSTKSSKEFREASDKLRQPVSAKLAIKEGGFFGKGPGNSTQRYVVSVMFGDYIFSFIIEEYGIWGAAIILILYVSLLARGAIIVRYCKSTFEKAAVAGLILLISGQAFMHMLINVDLFPLTGQTLPLVSHGTSSFLMFCVAFGVVLSISRIAKKDMDKEQKEMIKDGGLGIVASGNEAQEIDEIQSGISDLDVIENQLND
ncbi:MAG: FtsW/RodA/SpoVE family cell cycle protein [Bacteroidales bacterium]|nr:FtsW/RodA/SpoVE family cell cycle protein [Bacteroidales bacterium]